MSGVSEHQDAAADDNNNNNSKIYITTYQKLIFILLGSQESSISKCEMSESSRLFGMTNRTARTIES